MIKKFSDNVLCLEKSDAIVRLQITVDADLFWFQGHFESFPLLAGVAQIDWVLHYFKSHLSDQYGFAGINNIKFQQPITPNEIVTLSLDHSQPDFLLFEFKANDVKSKGKIKLKSLC